MAQSAQKAPGHLQLRPGWKRGGQNIPQSLPPVRPKKNQLFFQVKKSTKGHDEKNQLSQVKELWLFWYGEKPEAVAKLVGANSDLQEVAESSGSWESGIPYEARTLLFKAVNNLIERSLLSKEFVRLGKWFVQPYDGSDRVLHKGSHLSFSFQYFVHGEIAVCTSVDVRQQLNILLC